MAPSHLPPPAVGRAASRISYSSRRSEVTGIDSVDDEEGFLHWDRTNKRLTSDHQSSISSVQKQTTTSDPPSTNNNRIENISSTNNISETTSSTSAGLEVSFKSSSIMDLSSCRDEALKIIDEVLSENNKES